MWKMPRNQRQANKKIQKIKHTRPKQSHNQNNKTPTSTPTPTSTSTRPKT